LSKRRNRPNNQFLRAIFEKDGRHCLARVCC
jgi:hypothetical protein